MSLPGAPHSYDEWLELSDEQRQDVAGNWNAYERECVGFAYTAAGRLAIVSEVPVRDVRVGTYHGGEYVLHVYVDDVAASQCPAMLQQTFEGFRVVWLPVSHLSR